MTVDTNNYNVTSRVSKFLPYSRDFPLSVKRVTQVVLGLLILTSAVAALFAHFQLQNALLFRAAVASGGCGLAVLLLVLIPRKKFSGEVSDIIVTPFPDDKTRAQEALQRCSSCKFQMIFLKVCKYKQYKLYFEEQDGEFKEKRNLVTDPDNAYLLIDAYGSKSAYDEQMSFCSSGEAGVPRVAREQPSLAAYFENKNNKRIVLSLQEYQTLSNHGRFPHRVVRLIEGTRWVC